MDVFSQRNTVCKHALHARTNGPGAHLANPKSPKKECIMNLIAPILAQAANASEDPGLLFVPIMGISTVLLGLTCIILLCTLMSKLCLAASPNFGVS